MPPTSPRVPGGVPDIPGPGTYNHVSDQYGSGYLGDAPSFSMGARKAVPRPDDASPGPVYSPMMLTPNAAGKIGDAPQFSFGSSKRFVGGDTGDPGPGRYAQNTTRKGSSLLGDAPKYGFGTSAQRVQKDNRYISKEHSNKSNYGAGSPGPMAYKLQEGLGQVQTGTCQPNSPRYTMRPRLVGHNPVGGGGARSIDLPAPGAYKADEAIGPQVHSARSTAASFSFTQSGRHRPELAPKKTQYIGKDYERQNLGIHSPGPQQYSTSHTPTAYRNQPSYTFSTESRF